MRKLQCVRCGGGFDVRDDHTKIVRRDVRGSPRPAAVEHLCGECRRNYVEGFLGRAADEQ